MKNLDSLEAFLPNEFTIFVECLRCLRDTVDSCFSFTLDPSYKEVIKKFRQTFEALRAAFGVSETNKLHITLNMSLNSLIELGKVSVNSVNKS